LRANCAALNKVHQSREAYRKLVSEFDEILQGTPRPTPVLEQNDLLM